VADRVAVGVDLGSSSARALAVDADGRVLGSTVAPYPGADRWPPGRAVPADWLQGCLAALAALARATPGAEAPAALCVTGQSPTTIPLGGGLAVTCRHPAGVTGTPVDQHVAQHAVLREELGDDVVPLQVWDWVDVRLGAPRVQGRWPGDPPLPGYGDVVPTGTVVGTADGELGVPSGTPLVAGAQDAYLSFWAGGADVAGRGLDPGGRTGGLAVAVDAGARPDGMYALPSARPGVDVVGGPVSSHGLILEWYARLTGLTVAELLDEAAGVPPGAGGVIVLPYLEGERAPRWNRELRAEIVGIGSDSGPAELARAVLEGTAYGLRHIARDLDDQGVPTDVVVCSGSPATSRLWCSIKASVLGIPVEVPEEPDLTAYGAALAAGAGAGWWPAPGVDPAAAWPRPAVEVIEPEPCDAYRLGFERFVELGDAATERLRRDR